MAGFQPISSGFSHTFKKGGLSLGLVTPVESYLFEDLPSLERHFERAQLAENLGFSALWLRDIPFHVPSFGDVGQMLDPFVYLGALAARTRTISLGVASVILPLRHPAHVAKSIASVDHLSGGRCIMGIASGDRPEEYPALNMDYDGRGARFRDSVEYIRACFSDWPTHQADQGILNGRMDMLPKPQSGTVPLLITGGSQQDPDWVATHGDGWITYPRSEAVQARLVSDYRARLAGAGQPDKPVLQSLYIDLMAKPDWPTRPIALGYQCGTRFLSEHLLALRDLGVNHVALNLRYNNADIEETMHRIAQDVMPALAP